MNNSLKKQNQIRSASNTKPLKNSSSTTKLGSSKINTGLLNKTKTATKVPKTKPKSTDKKIKKSKSVEPICLNKNLEVLNKLLTNAQQITNEQDLLINKFSDITKKITANDYEIERLLNKNENDDFAGVLEKYSGNLSHILTKLKNHTEEAENIKCI
jgi:hypothetical protein